MKNKIVWGARLLAAAIYCKLYILNSRARLSRFIFLKPWGPSLGGVGLRAVAN